MRSPLLGSALLVAATTLAAGTAAAQNAPTDQHVVPAAATPDSRCGWSLDVDGTRCVVGAPEATHTFTEQGAATVFEFDGTGLVEVATLLASAPRALDGFGWSVAVDGDRCVVGAPYRAGTSLPSAVGGPPWVGAVYVFDRRPNGTWTETDVLTLAAPRPDDLFGWNVELDGDRLAVCIGSADDAGTDGGAVAILERDGSGTWNEVARFTGSDTGTFDTFGHALALRGDRLFVGAPTNDTNALDGGAVYVFDRSASGVWNEVQRIGVPDNSITTRFGTSLDVDGDRLLVGAPGHDLAPGGPNAGSAWLFHANGSGTFGTGVQLNDPMPQQDARFGDAVALAGDRMLVASPGWGAADEGAATLWTELAPGAWSVAIRTLPLEGVALGSFGKGVGLGDDFAALGQPEVAHLSGEFGGVDVLRTGTLYRGVSDVRLLFGGFQALRLRLGPQWANAVYLVVGSASGTSPATPLPGGIDVPLVADAYTNATLALEAPLLGPIAVLGADGWRDTSGFVLPAGSDPQLAGTVLHHACLVVDPTTFAVTATNAVAVELVP